MKRRIEMLKLNAVLVGAVLFLGGCSTVYYHQGGVIGGGYVDKPLGGGVYEVDFEAVHGTADNAMYAVTYRASEIAWKKGVRYFRFLRASDESQAMYAHTGYATQDYTVTNGIMMTKVKLVQDVPVKGKMYYQSYYKYKGDKYFDAYSILDNKYVPGTTTVYTRAMRRKDAGKGIDTWEDRVNQQQGN